MEEKNKNYWCYRIDTSRSSYFMKELQQGRLRQGWGWDVLQDLRNLKLDQGAKRNLSMFRKVKKGDILLIPRLPFSDDVALVRATEDWDKGYQFEIDEELKDYGHIFPAIYLKSFKRNNSNCTAQIRATLKNIQRFWNIKSLGKDVENLLVAKETELQTRQNHNSRFKNSIESIFKQTFNENEFSELFYEKLTKDFTNEEWEYAIVQGLQKLYPYFEISRTGGITEAKHGTDILIKIPSLIPNSTYGIAIQVKDYSNIVGNEVISQINKSRLYWEKENIIIIDKIVIVTKAKKGDNISLANQDLSVNFIFTNDFKDLMLQIGKKYVSDFLRINY
jgi:hypothetical protein